MYICKHDFNFTENVVSCLLISVNRLRVLCLNAVPLGKMRESVNVIIEIAADSGPVKYEVCRKCNVHVDRFINTDVYFAHYGFVPDTLCEDGDPLNVLVVAPFDLVPGCVIECRPVGVLKMADEKGEDSKLLAVPVSGITSLYDQVTDITDLPSVLINKVQYFFEHYKDLEPGKWVKVTGFEGAASARQEVINAMTLYKQTS